MGAKTCMMVYSNGNGIDTLKTYPSPDTNKTVYSLGVLFPEVELLPLDDGNLSDTNPPEDELFAGVYGDVFVVAASEFAIDYPSQIDERFLTDRFGNTIQFHAMHSVIDWFAYAVWKNRQLVRSLSLSADDGVIEDIGAKMDFEFPYWDGEHDDDLDPEFDYPFPFSPLELGEEALKTLFGYQLEGHPDDSEFDAMEIPLLRFRRIKKKRSWGKLFSR